MIRKVEHKQIMLVGNHSVYVEKDEYHEEEHLVTIWYFLFIPIFKSKKLLSSK